MSTIRTLCALTILIIGLGACLAPDEAPDGLAGQVVRELRAPLDRAWRETVAAIHETGVAVPRNKPPEGSTAQIRTDVLRVDLLWVDGGDTTMATVLYYGRDALSARARAESLLETIEDRLDRYGSER